MLKFQKDFRADEFQVNGHVFENMRAWIFFLVALSQLSSKLEEMQFHSFGDMIWTQFPMLITYSISCKGYNLTLRDCHNVVFCEGTAVLLTIT